MSLINNGFGKFIDRQAVKDYSKEYKLEHLEIFRICKQILEDLNEL